MSVEEQLFKSGLKELRPRGLRLQDDGSTGIDDTGNIAFEPTAVVLPNTIQIATEDPDTMIEVSFRLVSKK